MTTSKVFHEKAGTVIAAAVAFIVLGLSVYLYIKQEYGIASTLVGTAITFFYAAFKQRTSKKIMEVPTLVRPREVIVDEDE